jgi:hypothetical protein
MRYTVMLVRLFAPAIACGCVAWILNVVIARLAVNPIGAPLVEFAKWLLPLALMSTVVAIGYGCWRYARWERGVDLGCFRCGGLLSPELRGRFGQFRRCLACGHAEA